MALKRCMALGCELGPAAVSERRQIPQKWRPSLALIIGLTVAASLIVPVLGFLVLRWATPIFGWKISVFWVSVAMFAVAGTIGAVQWRILVRPIRALAAASQGIASGRTKRAKPIGHYGTKELRDLGDSVLDMAGDLQDRHLALRGYADHVIHELKSPLTTLQAAAELLQTNTVPAAHRRNLIEDMAKATDRMNQLLDGLRRHSKSQGAAVSGSTAVADLACVQAADVHVFGAPFVPLADDAAAAVIEQLIENARQAGASRIDICETETGLQIGDSGQGIESADLFRVFDPFFTTKRDIGGTGMGLSVVKSLLESGGATVSLWQKNGGAAVSVLVGREFVSKTSRSPQADL